MVTETRRGLQNLARYADVVQGDQTKAARVRAKLQEVEIFLQEEELSGINNPRQLIDEARAKREGEKYVQYQNHLAAVAQEALRVEGDEFVHSTRASVRRAVKAAIAQNTDSRLIPNYSDARLEHHVFDAGVAIALGPVIRTSGMGMDMDAWRDRIHMPLTQFVAQDDFPNIVRYEGWRQTLRQASQTLPEGTDAFDVTTLLMHLTQVGGHKLVSERVAEIQKLR